MLSYIQWNIFLICDSLIIYNDSSLSRERQTVHTAATLLPSTCIVNFQSSICCHFHMGNLQNQYFSPTYPTVMANQWSQYSMYATWIFMSVGQITANHKTVLVDFTKPHLQYNVLGNVNNKEPVETSLLCFKHHSKFSGCDILRNIVRPGYNLLSMDKVGSLFRSPHDRSSQNPAVMKEIQNMILTRKASSISSSNFLPQMLCPPFPVPVGSPVWTMKPLMFLERWETLRGTYKKLHDTSPYHSQVLTFLDTKVCYMIINYSR